VDPQNIHRTKLEPNTAQDTAMPSVSSCLLFMGKQTLTNGEFTALVVPN